jgi:poly(glycerol-phosphate) alpha-glucosyltransferase
MFGLGYAALHLAAALERAGVNVYLASVDEKTVAHQACEESGFPIERYICGSLLGPSRFGFAPFLTRQLSRIPNNGRLIVHSHGLWTYSSFAAGVISEWFQCPLVVSPHGELEPYALSISPRKKAIASLVFVRRNLEKASCLWALSEQERSSIREYGFAGKVAVIPNGVNRADICSDQEIAEFNRKHGVTPGSRVMLFLSRIARKKNLPLLLRAFAKHVKAHPEWVLLIAGSDERGHIHEVQALIHELGMEKSVRLTGQLSGKEKAAAFTSASVFVLPSHSEGLPIAVLEAMEYGKPLLLTDGWSLPVTTCARIGWRIPGEDHAFQDALLDVLNTPGEILREIGLNARALVREHFGWDGVAKQACTLYASLLASGNKGLN